MITSWARPPVEGVAPVAPQKWLRIERADWMIAALKGRISTKPQVGGPSIGSKRGGLAKGGRGIRNASNRVGRCSIEQVCIWISLCVVSISIC